MEAMIILRRQPENSDLIISFGQFVISDEFASGELVALFSVPGGRKGDLDPELGDFVNWKDDGATIGGRYDSIGIIRLLGNAGLRNKFAREKVVEILVSFQVLDKKVGGRNAIFADEMRLYQLRLSREKGTILAMDSGASKCLPCSCDSFKNKRSRYPSSRATVRLYF